MSDIKLISIKESILKDNDNDAEFLRAKLAKENVFMLNIMSSPGAGKTSLIIATLKVLQHKYRISVIEGDIDSMVDSEKIVQNGGNAIQIHTGGDCHLDAYMIKFAVDTMNLSDFDLLFIENVGNLVCPAEFDTGANLKVMILSVPEGDDKILKYPLMFQVCDALIINKIDCVKMFDFDFEVLKHRAALVNPKMKLFEVSAKTMEGITEWSDWLSEQIDDYKSQLI
jgi:hydrogenase nickel incorporation protein HypB